MDDIASALTQILGNPQSVQQIQSMAAGFDLSALSDILGSLNTPPAPPGPPAQQIEPAAGQIDSAMLQNLLQALGSMQSQQQPPAAGPAAAASAGLGADGLAALLRAGNPPDTQQQSAAEAPFDLNAMLKLQQAMSSMQSSRSNVDLLLSLKPRLSDKKNKKVDDAIKFMQLIPFFPLLKETGIFSGLDQILGSFGVKLGGGSAAGGGLGKLLSGFLGGR